MPGVAAVKRQMWRAEPRPEVSEDVRIQVAEHFRPDVNRLAKLTGRDLSSWAPVTPHADGDQSLTHPRRD